MMSLTRTVVDAIFDQYHRNGHRHYGEEVTELQHALQAAMLARLGGEGPHLIAAALLHDCGHLLHGLNEEIAREGIDASHETVGARFLSRHFPIEVAEPVRLHVAAKRYLCRREPSYLSALSVASRHSLELQGGPFTAEEAAAFELLPFSAPAIRLRRYDDSAKVVRADTPPLEDYRPLLASLVVSAQESASDL